MTGIVVSKRDGIAKAPDGTQHRVYRGKTLADAQHPVVLAYPGDWLPMEVHLSVPGGETEPAAPAGDAQVLATLEELRNELAEATELAEDAVQEFERLQRALAANGVALPAEDARETGWLVDLVIDVVETWRSDNASAVDVTPLDAEPETAVAPRPPRKRTPAR